MIKNLNSLIKQYYSREFLLNTYIVACKRNALCSQNAHKTGKQIGELLYEYSGWKYGDIFDVYIFKNQFLLTENKWINFYKSLRQIKNPKFVEIDKYTYINDLSHFEYFNNLKKERCREFSKEYGFIFSLFDENYILLEPYVRSIILNSLSIEPNHHFEIYDFYRQSEYFSIFYFIPVVRKCIWRICVVLVPFKVKYGENGCYEINYIIYNGDKINVIPEIELYGDKKQQNCITLQILKMHLYMESNYRIYLLMNLKIA